MGSGRIKIFMLGKDNVGWSIDKDREAITYFLKKNNFSITNNIFKATHIFCVWYDLLFNFKYYWINHFKNISNKKLITVITNDITFTQHKLSLLKKFSDVCIAPSKKIFYFLEKHKVKKVYRIPFFVNPRLFKPLALSKEKICQILKINYKQIENKIIIGSFQRDSLGHNLLEPKWQKNPDLSIKVLEKLPREKYLLLLAGPRRHYIIKKCKEKNLPYLFYGDKKPINSNKDDIFINNLDPTIINYLYNLVDIYIVSSKSEGGPKQVLESSLAKTLIFSTKVGLSPDILHPYLLFDEDKINLLVEKIAKFSNQPEGFDKYVEYNFERAMDEMNPEVLMEKYKKVILES